MKRDLDRLSRNTFDVLIIGGGIYGAFTAWAAALRGLEVALVEKSDFMSGTSSNSLKVLHGGLRYLQDMRLDLARRMAVERREMMRIAPHLVRPLPFLLPTHGWGLRSRSAMGAAIKLNDLLSADRNLGLPEEIQLPGGGVMTQAEFLAAVPGYLPSRGITGAVKWYDAQVVDSERYGIELLKSADELGACLANYVEAKEIGHRRGNVTGATSVDLLTSDQFDIRSKAVINACGPWLHDVLEKSGLPASHREYSPSLAMNVVVDRQLPFDTAVGVAAGERTNGSSSHAGDSGLVFVVPWNGRTIIGTVHRNYAGPPDAIESDWDLIERMLEQVNQKLVSLDLSGVDVQLVHKGLLPAQTSRGRRRRVRLVREGQVLDHRADEIEGLISIVGVKYTAARYLAESAIDLVAQHVPGARRQPLTRRRTVTAARVAAPSSAEARERPQSSNQLPGQLFGELVRSYGANYQKVLDELGGLGGDRSVENSSSSDLLRAKVRYAVREEMAVKLDDVITRRTGIGSGGPPDANRVRICADEMANMLGWSRSELERQVKDATGASLSRDLINGGD